MGERQAVKTELRTVGLFAVDNGMLEADGRAIDGCGHCGFSDSLAWETWAHVELGVHAGAYHRIVCKTCGVAGPKDPSPPKAEEHWNAMQNTLRAADG